MTQGFGHTAVAGGGPVGSEAVQSMRIKGALDECHTREVPLQQLRRGQRFQFVLPIQKKSYSGTVLRMGVGTAIVVLDGHEELQDVEVREGKERVIRTSGGPLYWPLSTPVIPLNEPLVDVSDFDVDSVGVKSVNDVKSDGEAKEQENMTAQAAVQLPGVKRIVVKASKPLTLAQRQQVNAAKRASQAPVKLVKSAKAKKAAVPKELHDCKCGCGTQVAGTFRMGHDARWYGWMRRIASGEEKRIADVPVNVRKRFTAAAAKAELKASGH